MNLEKLKELSDQIGKAIALQIDETNPAEITGKLNELTNLLSTSAYAVALSQMLYSQKIQELTESNQWAGLSATDKKMIFSGRAKQEGFYVSLSDRQNSGLVHGIDALRSLLSYLKTELERLPSN